MSDNDKLLSMDMKDLAVAICEEPNIDKSKDLIDLFNWNLSKKQISRVAKLDELFDDVTDQMILRFKTKPDQFSNDDLLNYMKTIQGAMDTTTKNIGEVPQAPKIIQNNTQININNEEVFDKDARARILAAVQATLQAATNPENNDYIISEDISDE